MTRHTTLRRSFVALALTLGLAACGGDDDSDSSPAEPTTEEPADTAPEEPADTGEATTDDTSEGEGDGETIESLDDIPERCLDLMEGFLGELEPIVSPVDWETATLAEFERIADEFEATATEFESENEAEGCNDLVFAEDDDGFALVIELARDVAPGTVPFFEFLEDMRTGVTPDESGEDAAGAGDCDDAIATIEDLMAEYDAVSEVPASELTKFADLATAMMSCSPEQLSFFESTEVSDFLNN